MGGFIGRVCVGFLVSLPVICTLVGDVNKGFGFLLLSIVCTAGISLAVWIPAWWVVGWVTLAVVSQIGNITNKVEPEPVSQLTVVPNPNKLALTAYVRQAMAFGMDADEMTRRLQLNGWEAAEIRTALQSCNSSKSKAEET